MGNMVLYECKICKIITKNKKNYEVHLNTLKHKKKISLLQNEDVLQKPCRTLQDPAGFSCKFCKKKFKRKDNLTVHMRERCQEIKKNKVLQEQILYQTEIENNSEIYKNENNSEIYKIENNSEIY